MGASCSAVRPRKRPELIFLVIGLDNSGKTTLTRTINGGASGAAQLRTRESKEGAALRAQ